VVITAAGIAWFIYGGAQNRGDWTDVPRDTLGYENLPGPEVVVRGRLEANTRVIFAVPKDGEVRLLTENQIDEIDANGSTQNYTTFHKVDWSHTLSTNDLSRKPSFTTGNENRYLILSTGTGAWRSSSVLKDYEGREVEMRGKWDSYSSPDYPLRGSVTQFHPRAIREAG